jgi:hypothetical protein
MTRKKPKSAANGLQNPKSAILLTEGNKPLNRFGLMFSLMFEDLKRPTR